MKNKNAALRFIFFTLLIDVTGLGIIIPVNELEEKQRRKEVAN